MERGRMRWGTNRIVRKTWMNKGNRWQNIAAFNIPEPLGFYGQFGRASWQTAIDRSCRCIKDGVYQCETQTPLQDWCGSHIAGSFALHLDPTGRGTQIFHSLGTHQDAFFPTDCKRWEDFEKPRKPRRTRFMATAILGAPDSRWNRLSATHRLYSLESRQAWLGAMR